MRCGSLWQNRRGLTTGPIVQTRRPDRQRRRFPNKAHGNDET